MSGTTNSKLYAIPGFAHVSAARQWMEIGMGRAYGFRGIDMLHVLREIDGIGYLDRSVDYPESEWTFKYDRRGIMRHILEFCLKNHDAKFSNIEYYTVGNFLLEMSGKPHFDAMGVVFPVAWEGVSK